MKTKHLTKNTLKIAFVLFFFPTLASFSATCNDTTSTNQQITTDFENLFAQTSVFIIKELAKTDADVNVFEVPNEILFDRKTDIPLDFVLRKTVVNGKAYFQVVEVKLIESKEMNSLISGINLNDELVFSPEALLNEMAKISNDETRNRVLKIQYLQEIE